MIGTLGNFECTALLGKGGMGEVYRATDQKLGRDVAIKVLPEEFARDRDRIARFQREAKLLASLNHPNIAAIYGLEESEGTHFLVLELIEGETLADRIKKGAIPVEESLQTALQIAGALEAAHEKSVIHRDLKPANIKVTPDGKVKVLDFGLAKAYAGDSDDYNLSNSPTLSVAATQQGMILGTAAYMSPEQARGKSVDRKTDIWAFGCVLYEMLTGQAAFQGEDVTEILAAVVKTEANLDLLPANIHPRIQEVLTRCLQKEQKKRYSDIGEAQYEIEKTMADPGGLFVQRISPAKPKMKTKFGIPWIAAAIALASIIVGLAVWQLKPIPSPEPRQVVRLDHVLQRDQQFHPLALNLGLTLAVSSDGSQFAYSTADGIYLRSADAFDARLIPGTDGDSFQPFFSPDGQWIGYGALPDMQLKKIAITGGAPVTLCDAPLFSGAVWNPDNTIVFAEAAGGFKRVSANGGNPETLIEARGGAPQLLPNTNSVMFTDGTTQPNKIVVQSLESGERKELFEGTVARYLPTGHIVYQLEDNLLAISFDLETLAPEGGPIPVVEGLGEYVVSDSGTLVYLPGAEGGAGPGQTLVWVDFEGNEEALSAEPNNYNRVRISPDGTKVALNIVSVNPDIWTWDLARETMTRLTFDGVTNNPPLWTPDGQRIVFSSESEEGFSLHWKAADGTGEIETIVSMSDLLLWPWSWSGDGKHLILQEIVLSPMSLNIGMLSMDDDAKRIPLLQEEYFTFYPKISPDGRWIAYQSNESGRGEIYVRPFPDVNKGKWQVSRNGGGSPLWAPDGRQLFYCSGEEVMAVAVQTESTFSLGTPRLLFRGMYVSNDFAVLSMTPWDISPDGKRFLMIKPPGYSAYPSSDEARPKINIVMNWLEELKQRVPVE